MFTPPLQLLRRACLLIGITITAIQLNAQIIGYDRLGNDTPPKTLPYLPVVDPK